MEKIIWTLIIGTTMASSPTKKPTGCPLDTPNLPSYIGPKLIDVVATRGDSLKHYYRSLRDLNVVMRENYRDMIEGIGHNIFPLIIASDSEPGFFGVGSTYTLFLEDGSSQRISPTGPEYEMYKSLSHMPLGLFTIISPYFKIPESPGWLPGMRAYQDKINTAVEALKTLRANNNFNESALFLMREMLNLASTYISSCIRKKSANMDDFMVFSNSIFPYVQESIKTAGRLQAFAALPALEKWKQELGNKWKDVYVVIPTVWPVSDRNTRQQIFEELMDKDKIATHIIKAEGARNTDDARSTLGRVVGDRSLAQIILGSNTQERYELSNALSSRNDLNEKACDKALNEYFGRPPTTGRCY